MRLLGLGAMALTLGLGGCMHDMSGHENMMDGMMGQHGRRECPSAERAQHGAGTQAGEQAEHQHQTGADECPRANQEEQQHEHGEQAQPN